MHGRLATHDYNQDDMYQVDIRVFGTLADLWSTLDRCSWMPSYTDTLVVRFDGLIFEDRELVVKELGIREGALLEICDAFDPFPQMGDSRRSMLPNDESEEVELGVWGSGDGIGAGASMSTRSTRWVKSDEDPLEIQEM